MKRGEKWLFIFGISMLVFLLFNSFVYNFIPGIYSSIFVGVCLVIFKLIFGFEKSNFRSTKEVLLDTLITILTFMLLYYLFGLIIDFAKVGNYFTLGGIKNYILPAILTTIFKEILRFNYLIKADMKKRLIALSIVVFIFLDIANNIYYGVFSDASHIFKFVALTLLYICT